MPQHTHTHTRTHTHARSHTHARTLARTHTHAFTPHNHTLPFHHPHTSCETRCENSVPHRPLSRASVSLQLHFGCLLPNAYIGKTQSLKCRHPVRALNLIFGLIDITVAYMAGAPKVSFVSCSLQPTSPETTIGGWHPLQVGLGNTALPICIQ
jgi:hypothetical protein